MNCKRARAAISLFIDERLDPTRQARLNRHLERCPGCAAYLRDLRAGLAMLHAQPEAEPSANFEWNLRRKLQRAILERELLSQRPGRVAFWPRFAAGAAAALAICVVGVWLLYDEGGPARTPLIPPSGPAVTAATEDAGFTSTPGRMPDQYRSRGARVQAVDGSTGQLATGSETRGAIEADDPYSGLPMQGARADSAGADSLAPTDPAP
ncbi:MAG: zf-HC2 domain-containing protein [Candidatus Krumholzibacteriota bacterium]|nr:zf-HC2 domain-containing protein [Candidatus Krumholzibacteriota bacterium]